MAFRRSKMLFCASLVGSKNNTLQGEFFRAARSCVWELIKGEKSKIGTPKWRAAKQVMCYEYWKQQQQQQKQNDNWTKRGWSTAETLLFFSVCFFLFFFLWNKPFLRYLSSKLQRYVLANQAKQAHLHECSWSATQFAREKNNFRINNKNRILIFCWFFSEKKRERDLNILSGPLHVLLGVSHSFSERDWAHCLLELSDQGRCVSSSNSNSGNLCSKTKHTWN